MEDKEFCQQCGWKGDTINLGVTWDGYVCPKCRAILISADNKEKMYAVTSKRVQILKQQMLDKTEKGE